MDKYWDIMQEEESEFLRVLRGLVDQAENLDILRYRYEKNRTER